jgi:two-component system, NarL family, nitrate/nitrite response regulator NarL
MGNSQFRILLADDHAMFRDGLKRLIALEPDLRVVGESGDVASAIRQTTQLQPDVILLDMAMPGGGGLDVLKALSSGPTTKTRAIVLTAASARSSLIEALQLGARGIVLKESVAGIAFTAIRAVMRNDYWVGDCAVAGLVQAILRLMTKNDNGDRKTNRFGLTPREMDIVPQVAAGASNKDIAQLFSLREDTVKHHLSNIFDKLGVGSRLELAIFAINHGLGEPPEYMVS